MLKWNRTQSNTVHSIASSIKILAIDIFTISPLTTVDEFIKISHYL